MHINISTIDLRPLENAPAESPNELVVFMHHSTYHQAYMLVARPQHVVGGGTTTYTEGQEVAAVFESAVVCDDERLAEIADNMMNHPAYLYVVDMALIKIKRYPTDEAWEVLRSCPSYPKG